MSGSKKFIALFCLLTLSVFIVPKEFIHSLYGHKDTIDIIFKDHSKHFEKTHIHCSILKLETPLYHNDGAIYLLEVNFQVKWYIDKIYETYALFLYSLSLSRATPFFVDSISQWTD